MSSASDIQSTVGNLVHKKLLSLEDGAELLVDIYGAFEWDVVPPPRDDEGEIDYAEWHELELQQAKRWLF